VIAYDHREIKPAAWPLALPDLSPEAQALWRDCVLAWPFWSIGQSMVEDVGPQKLHGAIGSTIAPATDWVGSPYGAALVWNGGSNDKVTVPDPASNWLDGTSQLSMAVLFKPTTLGGAGVNYGLLNKYQPSTGLRSWRLQFDGDELALQTSNDGAGNEEQLTTNANLVTGTWYHLVVTFDAGVWQAYLNGVLLTTNGDFSTHTSIFGGTAEFKVGQRTTSGGSADTTFNGHIADVRIWNPRVLSAEDARYLYENRWAMYDHGLWLPSLAVLHSGSAAAGPWISAGLVAKGIQAKMITGLNNGMSYDVKSETIDASGNRSAGSTPVSATPAAAAARPKHLLRPIGVLAPHPRRTRWTR
jgi:hypothetical protein